MNPLCLLTKGRTFKDMSPRAGAYKLLANSGLPKFSAKERTSRFSQPAPQPAQPSLFEQVAKPMPAPIVHLGPVPTFDTPKPEMAIVGSPFGQASKAVAKKPKMGIGGVWKRATRFCKHAFQRFVFGRKGRPIHRATVQAELALEKVTVMRNNLNEDDLEVVLVERTVGTGEKPLARLSKMEMTGEAWLRLTAPFRKKNSESATSPKAEAKPSPELSARA